MSKPRVLTRCVANNYAADDERIIEFSNGAGIGGLISFVWDEADGVLRVSIYSQDRAVSVHVGEPKS